MKFNFLKGSIPSICSRFPVNLSARDEFLQTKSKAACLYSETRVIKKAALLLLILLSFVTTSLCAQVSPNDGAGGPILVISNSANPFSRYFAEILRSEGLNEFAVKDITQVTAADLNNYDIVVLGEMSLSTSNVTMFTDWVNAGGTLISMRPDAQLATLLGVTPGTGTLTDKYLLVNATTEQGKGIVGQTIQYHGAANLYTLSGATAIATLYSSATAATTNPAVTVRDVGTNGGQAVAFAYDLARSVVYTRQGNPAWAGQERDAQTPIRSDDLYYGNASFDKQSDWVDLNKVAIPQADEQQHLLTNIIIQGNADKKPLPRFWFLPRGVKAAIVMTGDDHANGGTSGRFDQYKALSSSNTLAAVNNWSAIRSSSYIYPGTSITNTIAKGYQTDSFDISLHLNTNCADWTPTSLQNFYTNQLQQLAAQLPGLLKPVTHRVHCLVWSDWASEAKVERNNNIRLNASYYYWPGSWLQNRAGMFTGSGMPMRFADVNGSIIDNFQLTTQMTDESDQIYPDFVDALLDKATGPEGYYGVFCANMHTDNVASTGSDAIVNSALNHNVPVVSSRQMLTWLDARNASTISSFVWNNNTLNFSISAAAGSNNNLQAMLPMDLKNLRLTTVTTNGAALTLRIETIKGIRYAFIPATTGAYVASYSIGSCTPPTASLNASPANCQGTSIALKLTAATGASPYSVVVNNQTYSNVVVGQNFTTISTEQSIWGSAGAPQSPSGNDGQSIEVGVKFRVAQSGTIAGIRFYKGVGNTGTHTGNLWTATGTKLASATFINETSSGWQEVRFSSPVSISANTTYVASYFSSAGGYAETGGFFSTAVTSGSITALQSGTDGQNGIYKYGATGFPSASFNNSNYWVDVIFKPAGSYTYNLTSVTAADGCNNTGALSTSTVTQSDLQSATQTFYQDVDKDGYGNPAVTVTGCTAPTGYVTQSGDCNDNNANVHPGAVEICGNGIDDNCNGTVDEGCTITYYRDADGDNYGNPAISQTGSTQPTGYVSNNADCDDNNSNIHPGAVELCNGIDDNCDGRIDEGCSLTTYYKDADGDTYGNPNISTTSTSQPVGYVANNTDCNDNIATIHPGATEICGNGIDDNCDGRIDEGCTTTTYYRDADGDGFGNPTISTTGTTQPLGYVNNNTDCDDNNASVNPGVAEICGNGIDDNCNGTIDEGCTIVAEQSIWGSSGTPANPNDFDGQTIEVGVKFRASQSGTITGIRFYKGTTNTGTHTGNLWTATGTNLASAVFVNETASGWQEIRFTNPVNISANTTYVASYFSSSGRYAFTNDFFTNNGLTSGSLTALQSGVDGGNGVYQYGASGFPGSSYRGSNYWVDVLFQPTSTVAARPVVKKQPTEQKLSVHVMPNPTSGKFTLFTHSAIKTAIVLRVIDGLGKVVETRTGLRPDTYLELGDRYHAGIYYAEAVQGNERVTLKLVKVAQ